MSLKISRQLRCSKELKIICLNCKLVTMFVLQSQRLIEVVQTPLIWLVSLLMLLRVVTTKLEQSMVNWRVLLLNIVKNANRRHSLLLRVFQTQSLVWDKQHHMFHLGKDFCIVVAKLGVSMVVASAEKAANYAIVVVILTLPVNIKADMFVYCSNKNTNRIILISFNLFILFK